jgi:hypothetical protein
MSALADAFSVFDDSDSEDDDNESIIQGGVTPVFSKPIDADGIALNKNVGSKALPPQPPQPLRSQNTWPVDIWAERPPLRMVTQLYATRPASIIATHHSLTTHPSAFCTVVGSSHL